VDWRAQWASVRRRRPSDAVCPQALRLYDAVRQLACSRKGPQSPPHSWPTCGARPRSPQWPPFAQLAQLAQLVSDGNKLTVILEAVLRLATVILEAVLRLALRTTRGDRGPVAALRKAMLATWLLGRPDDEHALGLGADRDCIPTSRPGWGPRQPWWT